MQRKQKPLWREYLETAIVAVLAAVILRIFVISAYRINSGSMEGSLLEGDFIFVNKLAYHWHGPERGDIIVFKAPPKPNRDFIKRVVGLPGDTIEVRNKIVYVNGRTLAEPQNAKHVDTAVFTADRSYRDNYGPTVVPASAYFVMGDNRDDSQDSRFWGCVPAANLIGKCQFVYWSWDPEQAFYEPFGFRPNRVFAATN